jgi:hypothetical protein
MSMPHSDGLLHLGKYADFAIFLEWRMRFFVLFHAQKKSLIDKNWSHRRERRERREIFSSPPASLKTQRTQRNDGEGKRLTAENAEKKYYLSLRDGSGYRKKSSIF